MEGQRKSLDLTPNLATADTSGWRLYGNDATTGARQSTNNRIYSYLNNNGVHVLAVLWTMSVFRLYTIYILVVVIFSAPMPKSTSPGGLEVRASD